MTPVTLTCWGYYHIAAGLRWLRSPSLVGDTTRLLLSWGDSGHPHLLGILPDCCWVEVTPVTLTCWGYYQIAAELRWLRPPSLVWDTTRLLLSWGDYGHPHFLGILPDLCWVEVTPTTLTCWGYYQIAAELRWLWPPSLVGDTTRLMLGWGDSDHPHLLGILPDCCWVEVTLTTLTCWGYYQIDAGLRWLRPPSLVGDTTRLLLGWGDSDHPHLLGILPDCCWVEVTLATLTCWGYYQIAAGLRWLWPPSLVGDTTRLLLGWGDSDHPHLLGILPDCCWVEVTPTTLTCWGYYQIADGLRWLWPPSLVGDTTRLLLGWGDSDHPHLLEILPDCCWVEVTLTTPTCWGYYQIYAGLRWLRPPSLVGDTTRLLLSWGDSDHPHLLGILPDWCWVEVTPTTLTCWGYYQIAAGLRWLRPPSLVGDTTRLLLGWGDSGHPHLLGILPDCCWVEVTLATLTCWGYYQIAAGLRWLWPPSLVGDTTRLLLSWGDSGHPHLLGILPDCCWVEVTPATLTSYGYYQIAAGLRWLWPPSLVGDTTRLLLGWGDSGHPHLLGILPDCCWVEVTPATLTCWGYYQIAAGLRWLWPPSLVGDTTRLLLGWGDSDHPHLLGILPDCCWVEVTPTTLTCWGYYQIADGLRWLWPPSLVWDTTRLLLGWGDPDHPHLLGILPDCCWVEVTPTTLTCWGYYQIAAGLRWLWPPSLVGDTTRLLLGWGDSGHPHLLGILPDCCWVEVTPVTHTCWGYYQIAAELRWLWPPSLVGDTTRLLLGWGDSGHPHLLGILPDCCWVEVTPATLTCWGYYQISAGLRWLRSPSLVGDTTRLLLGWGDSGHPHLLGILPDCCWVEVTPVTLTCWGYYQIAAELRWLWPPSLVGDTTRLLLGWGDSGNPHFLGILPDCCWVEVTPTTLTCWGYYQIAAGLRWLRPPSLVGDTTRLLLVWGDSGHPHLLGILPDCCWVEVTPVTLTCWEYYQIAAELRWLRSPSLVGDTTRLLLGWGDSGHPHLLGILPYCCWVEVTPVTLTCWGYYQIAAELRWLRPPSLVGDTTRLLLGWGDSGHPHLLGILPDCCWVEVTPATLTCLGYYQIAAELRWLRSPSLFGDTTRFMLGWGDSDHPHLLGILPDCCWVEVTLTTLTCWGYYQIDAGLRWLRPPSLVGDTTRLLLSWGDSDHPHLLGILPDWCWVEVTPTTLTCWGYYQIAAGLRWLRPPSFVGDTTRLLLGWGDSGHPHLLGILPDCCWVEVTLATLTCWGYYQIAAGLRWLRPPSLVGDTTRLLLGWGDSDHPHLLGILPDCWWVEVTLATLTCWGYYQIAAGLRWLRPPSLVGDTTRLLLSWGDSDHPHLLGILPDLCWVEVTPTTLTCWGYYQIAAELRWLWPPPLVGDTTRLMLGWGDSDHPHLLGILPDCCWVEVTPTTLTCWGYYQIAAGLRWLWPPSLVGDTTRLLLGWGDSGHLTCWGYYQIAAGLRWLWPPSLVGDTTRLLLSWGDSGHPHLLGILPDCCWVEVTPATLTSYGYYQIAAGLRWLWPPSLVGDTTRLLLGWGDSGHPHLLGILPDCCWVEVTPATLTCWGYYQIAAGLRWLWPPSLVGDTTRLLLGWGDSDHPHLLGILPDCCWVEVTPTTLTCWGYYQIADGLRWLWPPSLVWDTTRLLLGWGDPDHPHLLGILPDCCWVEVTPTTLTCWGYYQIAAGLRWLWPPSLVGDTTRLLLGWGDSGHPHLLGILPDCCWVEVTPVTHTCWGYYQIAAELRWLWPPSLVGDTTRLLLGWGDSGHPHLLGILPDCCWVEVTPATLTCWGYYQISAGLRWLRSPSLVGDTTRLLLGWGDSGHPHLLGILPDCCWVEVTPVTLTCWGYYQIAAELRWLWPPSLVGDTTRLLLGWGDSGNPHLLGILPDCCWVEVTLVTLTCWGYYQIAAELRWLRSPSLVGDTTRLLLGWGESGHPHLLGILPDCCWVEVTPATLTCWGYYQIAAELRWLRSPSLVGDTTRFMLGWGDSDHPHLLGILSDWCWVEVTLTTLTCWGYYQIAAGLRWLRPPSFVGDTTRLLLGWGDSGHPHLLGILPDCCWVEVTLATLTCWGYYQIAAGLRWLRPPSLVGDTTRLLLGWGDSDHPHLLGILPDCWWVEVTLATLTCWGYYQIAAGLRWLRPPSIVGDTTRLLLGWGDSDHPHLLGILPDCCWVEVTLANLTCWGYYQIAAGLRWLRPPSLVGDTTRLLLGWGDSGHPHLLGILPDCCWVEVTLATLTCWGYYQIAAGLRWLWPPSLVGDTTRLLLGRGDSSHPHLLGILPDCCWVEVTPVTLTCWGYYQIAAGLRWLRSTSLVGDTTRLLLGWGDSGHPHLLGILQDCCWVEVTLATLTCWGYYQIAAGLRWHQ